MALNQSKHDHTKDRHVDTDSILWSQNEIPFCGLKTEGYLKLIRILSSSLLQVKFHERIFSADCQLCLASKYKCFLADYTMTLLSTKDMRLSIYHIIDRYENRKEFFVL